MVAKVSKHSRTGDWFLFISESCFTSRILNRIDMDRRPVSRAGIGPVRIAVSPVYVHLYPVIVSVSFFMSHGP